MRRTLAIAIALGWLLPAPASPIRTSPSQSTKPLYRPSEHHGVVSGTVSFRGRVPKQSRLNMESDPACEKVNPRQYAETVVVSGRRVANVFVYLKSGSALDDFRFDTPTTSVMLDQRGCRYVPHVLGIQTNQILEVTNSDPTVHNVHRVPKNNTEWNLSQVEGAAPLTTRFLNPEIAVPIKCNQHPWMKAYVGVLSHPFFAVSDRRGNFRIDGLPPGNYTIAVWHERLGEQTREITVGVGSPALINFEFDAKDSPHLYDPYWR